MGNSTKPGPLREGENVIHLPTAHTGRESGNHPVGNDMNKSETAPAVVENTPAPDPTPVTDLRASIGEHLGKVLDFSDVRKKNIRNSSTGRKTLRTSATNPRRENKKGLKKTQPKPKPLKSVKPKQEEPTHPDHDEISRYPALVEFLEITDEGYEVIATVFCKMRIALRESMVEAGVWEGSAKEMPDNRNWFEPISLEKAVERLESSELDGLVDRVSNPKLSDEVRDLADDELFGKVAHTILMMERKFPRFKFSDDFINSICDRLVERFGKKDKGIRQLIVAKLGPDFELFLKKQAEQRWGGVKVHSTGEAPRLVLFEEDTDNDK